MTESLSVKKLTVAFQSTANTTTAVDEVSFSLKPGETLALLGESGCGKSITSLALMRLLPLNGVYGHASVIDFDKTNLLDLPERLMRTLRGKRLAMIFQEPMTALNPVLSIGEQLAEALPKKQKTTQNELIALLEEVEIPDPATRLKQYPHQLSGGQKQRVMIAMALASRPDILIADEPTTALDVTIQAQVLTLLKRLQKQYQMSLLLITHDLTVVKRMANQVCVMYAGQVVESGPVEDFFEKPLHPYSQQLLLSIPSMSQRGERLQVIPGSVPTLMARPSGCRFHPRCAHAFTTCSSLEPQIQSREGGRDIRCHLYPEHTQPPPLNVASQPKLKKAISDDIILSAHDLSVYFYPKKQLLKKIQPFKAVDKVSFSLKKGKTLAVVGESGSGKSTLCRALLKLQPITSGDAVFCGEKVDAMSRRALRGYRKKVQIIFQDPFSSMNPRMTVRNILIEGMLAQGYRSKTINTKLPLLLDQVNLPKNCLERYPHQFSGGQRQRICIARALATEPEVLICDEPTSALDVSVQAQILNLLTDIQQEQGISYLFVTHDMGVVSYMADDVMVMQHGKVVESAPCEAIFKAPDNPYTQQLLASVLLI